MSSHYTETNRKKGFTMVELIVVMAIIGIAAGIAVPSLSNTVERMRIRDIIHSAQIVEDATMELVGLQYANSDTGNPLLMSWPGSPSEQSNAAAQYVYVQKGVTYSSGGAGECFRLAPANLAASGTARASDGLSELYKRTMNDLPAVGWKNGYEQNLTCSIYFLLSGSNINTDASAIDSGKYVRYDFAYSEYFMTDNGTDYAVYHGIRFHGNGAAKGDAATGSPSRDAGAWHIYEITGGQMKYFGSSK